MRKMRRLTLPIKSWCCVDLEARAVDVLLMERVDVVLINKRGIEPVPFSAMIATSFMTLFSIPTADSSLAKKPSNMGLFVPLTP